MVTNSPIESPIFLSPSSLYVFAKTHGQYSDALYSSLNILFLAISSDISHSLSNLTDGFFFNHSFKKSNNLSFFISPFFTTNILEASFFLYLVQLYSGLAKYFSTSGLSNEVHINTGINALDCTLFKKAITSLALPSSSPLLNIQSQITIDNLCPANSLSFGNVSFVITEKFCVLKYSAIVHASVYSSSTSSSIISISPTNIFFI